jgi:hypothetical protein
MPHCPTGHGSLVQELEGKKGKEFIEVDEFVNWTLMRRA